MFSIRYLEKSTSTPNGQIFAEVSQEAEWLFNQDEREFIFRIKRNSEPIWECYIYPNSWAYWHCEHNDNIEAFIYDNDGKIISYFKLDPWTNQNATEQFFDTYILRNPNSNGLVIGTHDGETGEWVKHVKNEKVNALLVEGSINQFNQLVRNYYNYNNVKMINHIVTGDGRDVEFYEFGSGFANTVDRSHFEKHNQTDLTNIVKTKSISINDLIIENDLQTNLDWIHLDTESIDDEIITSLDFKKINKPKLIVFETINFSEERTGSDLRIKKLFEWLELHGYKTKYDFWNSFAFLT
jgi:hypothetical protein